MSKNQNADTGAPKPSWTVRHSDADELPKVARVFGQALLITDDIDSMLERMRPLHDAVGYERLLVAVDDREGEEEVIGTANHFPFEMTMPGGRFPVAGVTGVGVWPTHRRQGVLSSLMRRQLADIHADGVRYAALWASEGSIYERFGYGMAFTEVETSVTRPHGALRADAPRDPDLRVVLREPERVRVDLERVHEAVAAQQVGQFRRTEPWWDRLLRDTPAQRGDKAPLAAAVVGGPDGPLGYALYRVRNKWETSGSEGEVHVQEITATTPAAWTALFEHLFSRDLVSKVVFDFLPADCPLHHLLANRDRAVATHQSALWVRLVDLAGALSERPYAAPFEGVLAVTDRYAPWNAGRWRIKADTGGARVELTDEEPHLSLDAAHLGAVHLGRTSLTGFLRAGLITEHTPGTVARLDTALHRFDAPFCGVVF
ncbi:GNAT family N-acetyltransferase [Nocardiopsis ganjiahuensis]|uniref:GNAT family N-acetyltransferase n=1 Tax=Nocardiopsis ganjiahuensis TaxID=239984 RepID=UPI0003465EEB|nr:GNAT family N-acetyltransferase [Nocardiopsis ganjiahuensis]